MKLRWKLAGGRIEISPQTGNNTDYFLNVMYVNDADKELALGEGRAD